MGNSAPAIFVGFDGSPGSQTALRWALEDTESRGGTVTAVMAWTFLDQRPRRGARAFDPQYDRNTADAALDDYVVEVAGDEAARVARRVVCDLPANALIDASRDADLLVVGTRGLGGFKRLLLGSVANQVVTYSHCPVVVVPPPADENDEAAADA